VTGGGTGIGFTIAEVLMRFTAFTLYFINCSLCDNFGLNCNFLFTN